MSRESEDWSAPGTTKQFKTLRDSRRPSGQLGVWRPRYAVRGCGRGVCSKKSNNPNLSGGEKQKTVLQPAKLHPARRGVVPHLDHGHGPAPTDVLHGPVQEGQLRLVHHGTGGVHDGAVVGAALAALPRAGATRRRSERREARPPPAAAPPLLLTPTSPYTPPLPPSPPIPLPPSPPIPLPPHPQHHRHDHHHQNRRRRRHSSSVSSSSSSSFHRHRHHPRHHRRHHHHR